MKRSKQYYCLINNYNNIILNARCCCCYNVAIVSDTLLFHSLQIIKLRGLCHKLKLNSWQLVYMLSFSDENGMLFLPLSMYQLPYKQYYFTQLFLCKIHVQPVNCNTLPSLFPHVPLIHSILLMCSSINFRSCSFF